MSIAERAIATSRPKEVFGRIVTDADVDKALSFLRDSAVDMGKSRERMMNAANLVKHVEALMFLTSEQKSVEAKKAEVRTSKRWLDATQEEAEAAGEFEKLKALREAASAKIEAWRSESANYRGMRA